MSIKMIKQKFIKAEVMGDTFLKLTYEVEDKYGNKYEYVIPSIELLKP